MPGETSIFQFPYPEGSDPPDGATQIKALAERVEAMMALGVREAAGPSTFTAASTNPVTIVNIKMDVVAGVPLFVMYSAWLQTATDWATPRCGVAYAGPFARSADSSPSHYIQNSAAVSSYITASGLHVIVPATSGRQSMTLAGWRSGNGSNPSVNYSRIVAWQGGGVPA